MINKETFSKHFAFIFSSFVKGCSYINVNSKLLMSGKSLKGHKSVSQFAVFMQFHP